MNNNEAIIVDGTKYFFNLTVIFEYINTREKTGKEKEIIDSYEMSNTTDELTLSSKVVREMVAPNDTQFDNIKYDLVKLLITELITFKEKEYNIDNMPLGLRIIFNTMVKYGFLITE